MITKLLQEFEKTLRVYNSKGLEALQEPLPKTTRDSLFTELGFYDQDLYDLYSWKNGCGFGNLTNAIFTFSTTLLKLETVVEYKNRFPGDYLNFETLLAIFANEEEGFLFNHGKGEDYGKIHLYSVPMLSIDEPCPYYDSLESMLQTTIVLYEEKALYYDSSSKFLDSNINAKIQIYKKYNPKCRYYDVNE